jgi:hypothetical protein
VRLRAGPGWVAAGALALLVAGCSGPGSDAAPTTGAGRLPVTAVASASTTSPAAPPASTSTDTPAVTAAAVPPADPTTEPIGPATIAAVTMPVSAPRTLTVPVLGIDSPLVELGRNPDGTVEVPSLDDPDARPGWYRGSPTPGAMGPAIVLGHVDSRRYGPGVFYRLADLRPGDAVEVTRADGTVARFAVDTVRVVAKRDFPTLEVYGNLDHAGLRLITCGGRFDPDAGSYESNTVVFASLVGSD